MAFANATNFKIEGSTIINVSESPRRNGIDILRDYNTLGAAYDSYVAESKARCLEGTRTQYIEDITTWTTSMNRVQKKRLMWMYGPAGVGKSAVAKSCAIKTAEEGRLAASFFFNRDSGVVDSQYFFPTIAYQIATEIPEFRKLLTAAIEVDPTILNKGLETQLHKLVVAPFLELKAQHVSISEKAVFVDGLDECAGDRAQAEIAELLAKLITRYNNRVPLVWAIFSRPEYHIDSALSKYSSSPYFWTVELPVSHNSDADIRLYLRDALCPHSSRKFISSISAAEDAWPSDQDLDSLVKIVAGLFIYAATVARFIMQLGPSGRQQRLRDVINHHFNQLDWELSVQSGGPSLDATRKLDSLYSLIMRSIPDDQRIIVQRILLLHATGNLRRLSYGAPSIALSAIIMGMSLREFEDPLSKLSSVLTFKPYNITTRYSFYSEDRLGSEPWPGSWTIYFFHASFMEFLRDPKRSKEYCFLDKSHYTDITLRAMRLGNDMYMMNGTSRGEKLRRLPRLLSVFPGDSFTSAKRLQFGDWVFTLLWRFILREWLLKSDLSPEILAELGRSNLADPWRPIERYSNFSTVLEYVSTRLPQDLRHCVVNPSLSGWKPPAALESEAASEHFFESYALIVLKWAKKADLKTLDDFALLSYYSNAWAEYYITPLSWGVPVTLEPWEEILLLMQGHEDRLTTASVNLVKRLWDGDVIHQYAKGESLERGILKHFCASLLLLSSSGIVSASECLDNFRTKLRQAAETHYGEVLETLPNDPIFCHLDHTGDFLDEEGYYGSAFGYSFPVGSDYWEGNLRWCIETLMGGRWTELYAEFNEIISAENRGNEHTEIIKRTMRIYPDNVRRELQAIFRAHLKRDALTAIADLLSSDDSGLEACASALLDLGKQRLWKVIGQLEPKYDDNPTGLKRTLEEGINEVLLEVQDEYPQLRDPLLELRVEQPKRACLARLKDLGIGYSELAVKRIMQEAERQSREWFRPIRAERTAAVTSLEGSDFSFASDLLANAVFEGSAASEPVQDAVHPDQLQLNMLDRISIFLRRVSSSIFLGFLVVLWYYIL